MKICATTDTRWLPAGPPRRHQQADPTCLQTTRIGTFSWS